MLVRLGTADSVPEGQRIVRAKLVPSVRALPGGTTSRAHDPIPEPEPKRLYEPAYVYDAQAAAQRAERACEAYRAAELIQPRPGLFLRVKA